MEEDLYILIDRYLAGEMNAGEQKDFEDRIKNDGDFAEKVLLYRSLTENLKSRFSGEDAETQLRESLSAISKSEFVPEKKARVISLRWYHWAAAASIALLAIAWFYNNTSTLPEYSQYAFRGSLSLAERGGNDSLQLEAEEAFNSKKYAQAIQPLNKLLEADPANAELQLFKGICLVELDQVKEAESIFNAIRDSNPVYKDKAIWYLALSALKQKDYDRCRALLEQLSADSEDHSKAMELLDRL
jgi:predicted Zn-dependent protease